MNDVMIKAIEEARKTMNENKGGPFGADLILHIIENLIVSVSDNHIGTILELLQVIDNQASEKRLSTLQCRLVNNHSCTFCLDPFHDSLNTTLSEVIGIALHGESVYANCDRAFLLSVPHG